MADLKSLAESLVNLTVKEAGELAKILKDEYGIEPAASAVAVAASGGKASEGSCRCRFKGGEGFGRCCSEAVEGGGLERRG